MVCLDTSFVIDVIKEDKEAISKKESIEKKNQAVTIAAPTIIELMRGLKSAGIKDEQEEKIGEFINSITTLCLDKDSAVEDGNIELSLVRKGLKVEIVGVMIAGICRANKERLLTRNAKHFCRMKGLEVEEY